jgi:ferredoxin
MEKYSPLEFPIIRGYKLEIPPIRALFLPWNRIYIIMAKLLIDRNKCCYCGGCVGVCPKDALTLMETYISADEAKCVSCGACVKFCPVDALKLER